MLFGKESRKRKVFGSSEGSKNCAENAWAQNTALSKRCRVCGLEALRTYIDGKSGKQTWAHIRTRKPSAEAMERAGPQKKAGHPWSGGRGFRETVYHEDGQAPESAK